MCILLLIVTFLYLKSQLPSSANQDMAKSKVIILYESANDCSISPKSAIFQLYHDNNNLII